MAVQQKTLHFKSTNKTALNFVSDYDVKLYGASSCFREALFAPEDSLKLSAKWTADTCKANSDLSGCPIKLRELTF